MARTPRIDIHGAVALVTGAGGGIGRATALALAGRGATVLCADLRADAAEEAADACAGGGAPSSAAYCLDVADRRQVDELVVEIAADHGPLGILVNNAGVGMSGPFVRMTADDWAWIRGVNLDGVVHACAAFGPAMLAQGRGHVVNVSSGLAYLPTASESAYGTTKAAVLALSQRLRADWGRAGVGVSAVCPGVIDTPILERSRFVGDSADDVEYRGRMERLFRKGHRPEKVAAGILDAVARDRAMVPVGFEARVGWYLHRLAPLALQEVLGRGGRG